jgi:hypothetical protein
MKKYLAFLLLLVLLLVLPSKSYPVTTVSAMFTHCSTETDRSGGGTETTTLNCTAVRTSILAAILVHSDTSANDVVNVYVNPKFRANYETLLYTNTWSSETDFMWIPDGRLLLGPGDIIKVTVSDSGDFGIVYVTIALEEVTWDR